MRGGEPLCGLPRQASISRTGASLTTIRFDEARGFACSDRCATETLTEERNPNVTRLQVEGHHNGTRYQDHPGLLSALLDSYSICF